MKLLYGLLFLITGCACAFASCRQLYRIIKLKLRGATCTATIIDFHEAVYSNQKAIIDEYPWTFNYPQGVAKMNVLCMHNRCFKPFIEWIFVFALSLLILFFIVPQFF